MELINEASELFIDKNNYESFLELKNSLTGIHDLWIKKIISLIELSPEMKKDGWIFYKHCGSNSDVRWQLEQSGVGSLCLVFEIYKNVQFSIWNSGANFDNNQMTQLLSQEKFQPLLGDLRRDFFDLNNEYKIAENGNFILGSKYDGKIPFEEFVWYAGNETEQLFAQILEKVKRFQKHKDLIVELNQACKRS